MLEKQCHWFSVAWCKKYDGSHVFLQLYITNHQRKTRSTEYAQKQSKAVQKGSEEISNVWSVPEFMKKAGAVTETNSELLGNH